MRPGVMVRNVAAMAGLQPLGWAGISSHGGFFLSRGPRRCVGTLPVAGRTVALFFFDT